MTTCRSTNVLGSSEPAKRALARPTTISPMSPSLTSLFVQHFLTKDWQMFPFTLHIHERPVLHSFKACSNLPHLYKRYFQKFMQFSSCKWRERNQEPLLDCRGSLEVPWRSEYQGVAGKTDGQSTYHQRSSLCYTYVYDLYLLHSSRQSGSLAVQA